MKSFILGLVLAFCLTEAYSQVTDLNITKSDAHIAIKGTKFLMIPPNASFQESETSPGFENKELEAIITITELPLAYEMILPSITNDLPAGLLLEKDLTMNGNKVKLVKVKFEKSGQEVMSWVMAYGNAERTILITTVYPPQHDKVLSDDIEKSLQSFLYSEDQKEDHFARLAFRVNVEGTPFKVASNIMDMGVAINLDGKFPSEAEDKSTMLIMVAPTAVAPEKQKEKAISEVTEKSDDGMALKEINPVSIGGLKGYEVIGYENKSNGKTLNYAVVLFDQSRHFVINAFTKEKIEERLDMFRKVSNTFQVTKK